MKTIYSKILFAISILAYTTNLPAFAGEGNNASSYLLNSFDAVPLEQQQIRLNWSTLTGDENIAYFSLYYSADAKDFTKLADINAKYSPLEAHYEYTLPAHGAKNYFYISIVDIDGNISNSSIIFCQAETKVMNVFPNPVQNEATFMVNASGNQLAEFWFYSPQGAVIRQLGVPLKQGNNERTYDLSHLDRGQYVLKGVIDGIPHSLTVIKE